MPARKFFAVPVDDLSRNKREKRQSVLISDDEEEDRDDLLSNFPKHLKLNPHPKWRKCIGIFSR